MPKIDIINCDIESITESYPFAPSMANESTTAGNISVFEDLVIGQLGLDKDDPRFGELLTLWWGDLKTEVQMLGMKGLGVGNKRAYDCYKHLFAGLALWHLRFNYLKMVWEIFYPGGSASECSTFQWAADHWHRDKTTRPTDFYSLEELTLHSYRSRIVAILKPWIYQQNRRLSIHDSKEVGKWLGQLSEAQWSESMR